MIDFLARKLPTALAKLAKYNPDGSHHTLSSDRFNKLRRIARSHSRTDHELIECIIAFGKACDSENNPLTPEKVMELVEHSLIASAVAEKTAADAAAKASSIFPNHLPGEITLTEAQTTNLGHLGLTPEKAKQISTRAFLELIEEIVTRTPESTTEAAKMRLLEALTWARFHYSQASA
jgi:hypothetical protein